MHPYTLDAPSDIIRQLCTSSTQSAVHVNTAARTTALHDCYHVNVIIIIRVSVSLEFIGYVRVLKG